MSAHLSMSPGLQAARLPDRTSDPDRAGRWVQAWAVCVLVLTLLYAALEISTDGVVGSSETDHIDPWNSWIWLGLLTAAMPVLMLRWRDVAALAKGCWPLLTLFAYFALSTQWALDPQASTRRLLFTLVQFSLLAILVTGIRRAPVLHLVVAGVCAAAAMTDLLYWIVAPGLAVDDEGFIGLQSQKNQTGLIMMYGCLALVPCTLLLRHWLSRVVCVAATAIVLALLVATRSTTSQAIIVAAAVAMPILLQIARLPRSAILAIAAVSALVPAVAMLIYIAWCGATGDDPMLPLRGVTLTDRTDIWSFVLGEIPKRLWTGAGYSSFWGINPAIQPSLKSDDWFGVDPTVINQGHNGYLDLLATGGIVGLAGGVFVLFRSIAVAARALTRSQQPAQAWRDATMARPTAIFHLSFLLGLTMHNLTESNLFSNNALLAVGLLVCVLDLEKWRLNTERGGKANVVGLHSGVDCWPGR